jgi:type II secretory pathway component PulF
MTQNSSATSPNNNSASASQKRAVIDVVIFSLIDLLAATLLFILALTARALPKYDAMYEGLGDKMPSISRFVLNNNILAFFLVVLIAIAWLLQHFLLLRSIKSVTVISTLFCFLSLGVILLFWYAIQSPMWVIQTAFPN